MKKKSNDKKKERRSLNDENRALNNELGNFGLEPPKIYRNRNKRDDYNRGGNRPRSNDDERRNRPTRQSGEQKRKRARRRTNKKTRKILFYFFLTIVVLAVAAVLCLTVLFKVHTISVKGNVVYTAKQVTTVLPVQKESNLFMIDKADAEEKIEENLPYVYKAEIKRKLPSTLVVNITETPQIYYIKNDDNSYTYLDDTLKVLETKAGAVPEGAIEIQKAMLKNAAVGQKAEFSKAKTAKNLTKLMDTLKDLKLAGITAIGSEDVNNNYMVYDGRITIKLDSLSKLERKIYASLAAAQKLDETNGKTSGTITATDDKQVYFTEK